MQRVKVFVDGLTLCIKVVKRPERGSSLRSYCYDQSSYSGKYYGRPSPVLEYNLARWESRKEDLF